jgi:hypothetical protein
MESRKRRNPYSDEAGYEAKSIKFDENTIKAKTWAILMSPQTRKSGSGANRLNVIRTSDSPAVDTVEALNNDITMTNCVDCSNPISESKNCSSCHRGVCDSCSQQCSRCLYHFCAVCRIMNYDDFDDRLFCLTCNDEVKQEQAEQAEQSLGNGMDIS